MKKFFAKQTSHLRTFIQKYSLFKKFLKLFGVGWALKMKEKYLTNKEKKLYSALQQDARCLAVPISYELNDEMSISPNIAVICHMFYTDLVDEFQLYFLNIPYSFDIYLTTDTVQKKTVLQEKFSDWKRGKIEIRIAPNHGRDIAPKLITCRDVYDHYEYILHVHSKKTLHTPSSNVWRHYLLNTLLGSPEIVKSIFEAFCVDNKLGMIAPQHYKTVKYLNLWGINYEKANVFAGKFGNRLKKDRLDFPSGSMFWARSAALKPLLDQQLSLNEFEIEENQIDGTLAHVIERSYFFICEKAGYRWIKIIPSSVFPSELKQQSIKNKNELRKFIQDNQYKLIRKNWMGLI